jgi:hypothetical protein
MKSKTIETVERGISPSEFYTRFVKPRIPCILNYVDYVNPLLASPAHLATRHTPCQVETFSQELGSFGAGTQRLNMPFSELIGRLEAGENLYKTTQYTEDDTFIHTPLIPSDFTNPKILASLVPQQVNLCK